MSDDNVAAEIIRMAGKDQRARRELMAVDRANVARLREIVASIGWPTHSKVGDRAEHQARLLLEHATPAFQERCLELMKAAREGEVCKDHIAYLQDRIAMQHGLPRPHGTQLRPTLNRSLEPSLIEDVEHVDARRAAIGLEPLAVYVSRASAHLRADG